MTGSELPGRDVRERLYEIGRRPIPADEKAQLALELGASYLGTENAMVTRTDTESGHWEVLVSIDGVDGWTPPQEELRLGETYCRRTIAEDEQVAIEDTSIETWANDPAFEATGLGSYLGLPLVLDGTTAGTVCFVSGEPAEEPFTADKRLFAELIARVVERELTRAQLEAELDSQTTLSTVLNRVLRHNLRNDISLIRGLTTEMIDQLDDESVGEIALEAIDDLIDLSEKARELERVVAAEASRQPTDLVALTERVAGRVAGEYPAASIEVSASEQVTIGLLPTFERAIAELLDNAAKHAGPEPSISVSIDPVPGAVEIQIVDDGPGLEAQEVEVLEAGTETPLTHGSGLGLWLAYWVLRRHDGAIEPTVTDDGTEMLLTVPTTAAAIDDEISALTRSRDTYRAAFDAAENALLIATDDARIVEANPSAATLFGLEQEQLLGQQLTRFMPAMVDFEATWTSILEERGCRAQTPILDATGREKQIECSAAADVVSGLHLLVARDVTAERERAQRLQLITDAIDEAPIGVTIADATQPDNPMVYVNDRFCTLIGYEEADIVGRNCRFVQGPDTDPETVSQIREAIDAGEPVSTVIRNYHRDGTPFLNRIHIAPIATENGQITNWVGFQEDVTDQIDEPL